MWQNCGPFGESPMAVANTCAPSVRDWYHTRSPGENILGLNKGHNTLYSQGCCVPVLPLDQCVMHLGQNLARCPRTTLEVGWWLRGFRRASSTA